MFRRKFLGSYPFLATRQGQLIPLLKVEAQALSDCANVSLVLC
jgi:hypothetical protein